MGGGGGGMVLVYPGAVEVLIGSTAELVEGVTAPYESGVVVFGVTGVVVEVVTAPYESGVVVVETTGAVVAANGDTVEVVGTTVETVELEAPTQPGWVSFWPRPLANLSSNSYTRRCEFYIPPRNRRNFHR